MTAGSVTMNGTTIDTGGGTLTAGSVTMLTQEYWDPAIQSGGILSPGASVTSTATRTATIATNTVLLTSPNTVFNIADGSVGVDMVVSANFVGTGGLTKSGAETMQISGRNNIFDGAFTVSAGKVELKPLGIRVIHCGPISVTGSAQLDVQDNKLITTSPVGTVSGSTYSGVTGLIQSGRNGGGWTGSGIVTSQSNASADILTSIGVATAAQVKGISTTATAVWAGQTVTGSNALVMYTYGGDATLDGKVNIDDYGRIDFNIPLGTSGWFNGDFNYDGKINVDDYGIMDFNVGRQGAPSSTAGGTDGVVLAPVPEPGSLAVLSLGAVVSGVIRRRRR